MYAVRREMARTLDDVLSRRTRARLLARDDSAAAADDAAALVGRELGWDDAERARQVKEYRAAVAAERDAADLPETALGDLAGGDGHDRAADATDRVRWARDRRARAPLGAGGHGRRRGAPAAALGVRRRDRRRRRGR